MTKCHIFLAPFKYMKINILPKKCPCPRIVRYVMEMLDMTDFSAILAVGYEEC